MNFPTPILERTEYWSNNYSVRQLSLFVWGMSPYPLRLYWMAQAPRSGLIQEAMLAFLGLRDYEMCSENAEIFTWGKFHLSNSNLRCCHSWLWSIGHSLRAPGESTCQFEGINPVFENTFNVHLKKIAPITRYLSNSYIPLCLVPILRRRQKTLIRVGNTTYLHVEVYCAHFLPVGNSIVGPG